MSSPTAGIQVIGLAGGTGSGKTTVAQALLSAVGASALTVLPQDAYYRKRTDMPGEEHVAINFDEPAAFDTELLVRHLDELRSGRQVQRPVYDFERDDRAAHTVPIPPTPVMVVEGILVLADPALRRRLDLKVFIDAPADERFIRRLQRDVRERGRSADSVIEQYRRTVRPMHDRYCEPSKRYADLIVPEGGDNLAALAVLCGYVRDLTGASATPGAR